MLKVAYISDLHLEFIARNNDVKWARIVDIKDIAQMFCDALKAVEYDIVVIAGDISHSPFTVDLFLSYVDELVEKPVYFCLGNHDYWNWEHSIGYKDTQFDPHGKSGYKLSPDTIYGVEGFFETRKYKNIKFLMAGKACTEQSTTIIGDCGFCGYNPKFNCTHGIYRDILRNPEKERELTLRWKNFFKHVLDNKKDGENLLVITHTPPTDWGWNKSTEVNGVFHIFGHVHDHHHHEVQQYTITAPNGEYGAFGDAANGYRKIDFEFKTLTINEML